MSIENIYIWLFMCIHYVKKYWNLIKINIINIIIYFIITMNNNLVIDNQNNETNNDDSNVLKRIKPTKKEFYKQERDLLISELNKIIGIDTDNYKIFLYDVQSCENFLKLAMLLSYK